MQKKVTKKIVTKKKAKRHSLRAPKRAAKDTGAKVAASKRPAALARFWQFGEERAFAVRGFFYRARRDRKTPDRTSRLSRLFGFRFGLWMDG